MIWRQETRACAEALVFCDRLLRHWWLYGPLLSGEENGALEASVYAIGLSGAVCRGGICMLVDPSSRNACSGIDDPGIVCCSGK